jgi:hypothetical protein
MQLLWRCRMTWHWLHKRCCCSNPTSCLQETCCCSDARQAQPGCRNSGLLTTSRHSSKRCVAELLQENSVLTCHRGLPGSWGPCPHWWGHHARTRLCTATARRDSRISTVLAGSLQTALQRCSAVSLLQTQYYCTACSPPKPCASQPKKACL